MKITNFGFKKYIWVLLFFLMAAHGAVSQNIIYDVKDSLFVEEILKKYATKSSAFCGERVIGIAKEFVGAEYVGNTLENDGEPLFVSTSKLDCTTFVELVMAVYITKVSEGFVGVCRNLEKIRYRNGVRDGYASRLHYISWWIADAEKKGVLKEVVSKWHTAEHFLWLDFMSSHPFNYPQLKNDRCLVNVIAGYEKSSNGSVVKYIPEEVIGCVGEQDIKDGDVIAIVTNVKGLDVSHVGFAYWRNGVLYMIHASSAKGIVTCDTLPLSEYISQRKSHIGIRVLRVL